MAAKKSTQSAQVSGKVVALPLRTGPSIDVEKLLLGGQSTPRVLVPKELQQAIDRRARALSEQAYTLCREHLQRRIAYTCEFGHPRELNTDWAFEVIEQGDLGDALMHEYKSRLQEMRFAAGRAMELSLKFDEQMKSALNSLSHSA